MTQTILKETQDKERKVSHELFNTLKSLEQIKYDSQNEIKMLRNQVREQLSQIDSSARMSSEKRFVEKIDQSQESFYSNGRNTVEYRPTNII